MKNFITAHSKLRELQIRRLHAHLTLPFPDEPVPALSAAVDATITSTCITKQSNREIPQDRTKYINLTSFPGFGRRHSTERLPEPSQERSQLR